MSEQRELCRGCVGIRSPQRSRGRCIHQVEVERRDLEDQLGTANEQVLDWSAKHAGEVFRAQRAEAALRQLIAPQQSHYCQHCGTQVAQNMMHACESIVRQIVRRALAAAAKVGDKAP